MSYEAYPDCIKTLPKAKIPLQGVQGWVAQGNDFQIVFFEIEPIGVIPPHSHKAQYGVVLEGEMKLTIGDKTRLCRKGDTYFVPEGAIHQAEFYTHFRAVDIFFEPNRYETEVM